MSARQIFASTPVSAAAALQITDRDLQRYRALAQALENTNDAQDFKHDDDIYQIIHPLYYTAPAFAGSLTSSSASALKRIISSKLVAPDDDDVKSERNWNAEFQEALESVFEQSSGVQMSSVERANAKVEKIQKVVRDFSNAVGRIARQIVDGELAKDDTPGNVGERYQSEGIVFQIAKDSTLYGTAGRNDIMKAADNELRGFNAILSAEIPGVSVPLCAVCDLRGYRLIAVAKLPVSRSTLVWGMSSEGEFVDKTSDSLKQILLKLGKKLKLQRHSCLMMVDGMPQTVDTPIVASIEVHQGKDGRIYVLNAGRVIPPATPSICVRNGEQVYNQFRPEFIETYKNILCSDSFSTYLRYDTEEHSKLSKEYNSNVQDAAKYLFEQRASALIKKLSQAFKERIDVVNYRDVFHAFGVNMRYLGVIRMAVLTAHSTKISEKLKFKFSYSILEEIIIRTLKTDIRRRMRDKHESEADESLRERACRKIFVDVVNLLMGCQSPTKEFSASYDRFWTRELKILIREKYPISLSEAEFDGISDELDFRHKIDRWYILKTLVAKFQMSLKSEVLIKRFGEVEELRKEWFRALQMDQDSDPLKIQEQLKLLKKNFEQFQDQLQDAFPNIRLKPSNGSGSNRTTLLKALITIDDFHPIRKVKVKTYNIVSRDVAKAVLSEFLQISESNRQDKAKRIELLKQAEDRFQQVLISKPNDLQALTFSAMCASKLAAESSNSWTSNKSCDRAEDLLKRALELNPDYSPAILELSRAQFVRAVWKQTSQERISDIVSSLTFFATAKGFDEYDFEEKVDIGASFSIMKMKMLRMLIDCLQSANLSFFFKLSGALDEKYLLSLMDMSKIYLEESLDLFIKASKSDVRNGLYITRLYMIRFIYLRQFQPEQVSKCQDFCKEMLIWLDIAMPASIKYDRSQGSRNFFERALALYFSALVNGDKKSFTESSKEFECAEIAKPFKNILIDRSLIWKFCSKFSDAPEQKREVAGQFFNQPNVVYNSEMFATYVTGSLSYGNSSEKSWEGKAFFQNLKKSIDVLELDKDTQFSFVHSVFVSFTDDVMKKSLISKVVFHIYSHSGSTKSITRTHPQEFKFTAVGTEPYNIRMEVTLSAPFESDPLVIEMTVHLEPPGLTHQQAVFLSLSEF